MFKIDSIDTNDSEKITLYRTITFSEDDIKNADSNGNIKKSVVISNLPEYNYEITQEINSRFILNSIIPVENASVNGNIGEANLQKNSKAEIIFKSNKNKNSLLSDCKLIISKFMGKV